MIRLYRLVVLQAVFACASISYLLFSAWRLHTTGEALSAAAIGPSIGLFIAYSLALSLPRFGFEHTYRIAIIKGSSLRLTHKGVFDNYRSCHVRFVFNIPMPGTT